MSAASLDLTLRRPFGNSQQVAYTGTAGTIALALPDSCATVMVWCSTAAYVSIGNASDHVATATSVPLTGSAMVILPVERPTAPAVASKMYVSAVRVSESGTLYVQPLAD